VLFKINYYNKKNLNINIYIFYYIFEIFEINFINKIKINHFMDKNILFLNKKKKKKKKKKKIIIFHFTK